MSEKENEKIIKVFGQKATPESIFYRDLGEKLESGSMDFLNQVLRQFVTISSAFCGGIIAIHGKEIVHVTCSTVALLIMIAGLFVSVFGILPAFHGKIELGMVTRIRDSYRKAVNIKVVTIYLVASLFSLSLITLVSGILWNLFNQ